ncbi:JmjC domain-containing protein [Chloropicon roscoffensis]|uniref:JmjC domain-containing protein n=1 Tax=Chloropicon roscoffensis TaxID=1461544 RepID=A0AAX4PEI5_9CHLO
MRFAKVLPMKYREKVLAKRVAAVLVLSTVSIFCFKAVRSGPRADNTPPQRVLESKPSKPLRTVAIQRVKAGSFDAKEFFDEFGDNVPVIVEGEVKHHPAYNMSLNTLKDLCGDGLVETSRYDATSGSWGGLVDTKYMHLREFVDDYLLKDTNRDGEPPRYLTDGLSLLQVCPKLDLYTPVPKYVSLSVYPIDLDHNKQTNGKRNQIGQPDMFIGNKGTKTEMHLDDMLGPFWMSVYLGSKTFRVVTYWDAVRHFDMYKKKGRGNRLIDQNARSQRWERSRYDDSTGKFEKRRMEIWNPDLDWFPELDNVTVWEGTVNAGDWIYLPSASLHGVRNDDASWGVTINALYPATVDN